MIDVEGVKVAGAVAIDALTNAGDGAVLPGLVYSATTDRAARRSDLVDTSTRLLKGADSPPYPMGRADRGMRVRIRATYGLCI